MNDDTQDRHRRVRLRFLAEATMEALSGERADAYASQRPLAPHASEDDLRNFLKCAAPVLRATIRQQLAEQVEAVLAEER